MRYCMYVDGDYEDTYSISDIIERLSDERGADDCYNLIDGVFHGLVTKCEVQSAMDDIWKEWSLRQCKNIDDIKEFLDDYGYYYGAEFTFKPATTNDVDTDILQVVYDYLSEIKIDCGKSIDDIADQIYDSLSTTEKCYIVRDIVDSIASYIKQDKDGTGWKIEQKTLEDFGFKEVRNDEDCVVFQRKYTDNYGELISGICFDKKKKTVYVDEYTECETLDFEMDINLLKAIYDKFREIINAEEEHDE